MLWYVTVRLMYVLEYTVPCSEILFPVLCFHYCLSCTRMTLVKARWRSDSITLTQGVSGQSRRTHSKRLESWQPDIDFNGSVQGFCSLERSLTIAIASILCIYCYTYDIHVIRLFVDRTESFRDAPAERCSSRGRDGSFPVFDPRCPSTCDHVDQGRTTFTSVGQVLSLIPDNLWAVNWFRHV